MKVLIAACLMLALSANQVLAQTAAAPVGAAPPQKVGYIVAATQPVYNEQSYVGRIQSPQIVQLNARVTGYLESQNFSDGDEVKKGQLLYVIEQPPYQAAVAEAQAGLDQAMAQARNANITLYRAKSLLNTPAGLPSNVDSSKAAAQSGSAQIAMAQAQLQTAQINLGYTEIRSPLDGQIGATSVNVGNVVGPSSGPLATIVAQDPMYVVFALPVVDALKFRRNSAAAGGLAGIDLLVQLPDGRMYGQTGAINFVSNQITANTDTLTWRGTIANPILPGNAALPGATRELTDGEFVQVILRARTPQNQIVVPRDAVTSDQLGDYVLGLDAGNHVVRRNVTLGVQTADSAQISAGVAPGDKIITEGVQRIHPGIQVTPQLAKRS